MLRKLLTPVNLIGVFALLIAMTGTAIAATGGNFILGQQNYAGTMTRLKNNGSGSALQLTTASASAAPLVVSNGTKVAKLNSDRLDSLDSTQLQRRVNGTCAAGLAIRVIASNGTVTCNAFQAKLARTVVVSPGASAVANGTALQNVMAAITTASASNPWLIKLEPGIFDLGTGTLTMKSHVGLEGSGVGATTLRSVPATAQHGCIRNVVVLADGTELRSVGIEATGSAGNCVGGVILTSAGTARLNDVRIEVDGTGTSNNTFGLSNTAGTLLADGVEAVVVDSPAIGVAVYSEGGVLRFVGGIASATASGSLNWSLRDEAGGIVRAAHSELTGTPSNATCIGVYDAAFAAVAC